MIAHNDALRAILAPHLKNYRLQLGLTQHAMSELFRISERSYVELEHGNSLCPSYVLVQFFIMIGEEQTSELLREIELAFEKLDSPISPPTAAMV
ncbi:MAG: hypothetical protein Q4B42_01445 [Oscillospiraceae bacterium]|nr:hypothetical protein [Oscillospiraceae bacterium]